MRSTHLCISSAHSGELVSNMPVTYLSLFTKWTRIGVNSPSSANRPYEKKDNNRLTDLMPSQFRSCGQSTEKRKNHQLVVQLLYCLIITFFYI